MHCNNVLDDGNFHMSIDNQIGSIGFFSLQRAISEQKKYLDYGTGILKLTLNHNVPSKLVTKCEQVYMDAPL